MKTTLVRIAALAASVLLPGCLVSETPLFDSENASAMPIAAGLYDACSGSTDDEAVECNPLTVELNDTGRYIFGVEDDRIEARFLDIGGGDYAVQMDDGDGEDFQYYWGELEDDALTLVMLWCENLPRGLVDKLIKDGAIETDDDYATCIVKAPGAVVVAARSYAAGEAVVDSWVKISPSIAKP